MRRWCIATCLSRFPLLVFVGMLRLWRTRGRDPELAPIAAQYEPPAQMTPAELGTLIDGKPDMRDITASIVDLAVRGVSPHRGDQNERLFGLFSNKDYTFTLKKTREQWKDLKKHERDLLDALFAGSVTSVSLSDLKNKFYKHLPGLRDELYGRLVKDGFYTGRPDRVRLLYTSAASSSACAIGFVSSWIMTRLGHAAVRGRSRQGSHQA